MKGKVVAWEDTIVIKEPKFIVSEAGRQRVIREKRKNVHAGIRGLWMGRCPFPLKNIGGHRITYNPYRFSSFVECDSLKPVHDATLASCEPLGVWVL